MKVSLYISRDVRNGASLDVRRDGYRYEVSDIPVEVTMDCKQGEWEVQSSKVTEDVLREDGSVLFYKNQAIELDNSEFNEAVFESVCSHENWLSENWGVKP